LKSENVTLDELERMEKSATPGPWEACNCKAHEHEDKPRSTCYRVRNAVGNIIPDEDKPLIAVARNALPELIKIAMAVAKGRNPIQFSEDTCWYCYGKGEHEESCPWPIANKLAGGVR
jgi:hypothetical protein